jgi:hypothetical protein
MKAGAHGEPFPADLKKLSKEVAREQYQASSRNMFRKTSQRVKNYK